MAKRSQTRRRLYSRINRPAGLILRKSAGVWPDSKSRHQGHSTGTPPPQPPLIETSHGQNFAAPPLAPLPVQRRSTGRISTITTAELCQLRISRADLRRLFAEAAKLLLGIKPRDQARLVVTRALDGHWEVHSDPTTKQPR